MKAESQRTLVEIAPYMFRYDGWNNLQKSLMGFGLEVGDGWYKILEELITKIAELDKEKRVKVVQVKEKFGGLRFYINSGTDEIFNVIDEAEAKSLITCEQCGKVGSIDVTHGWMLTLCEDCKEVRK